MKQKLLLALLALFTLGGSNLFAQTDVTDQYITNADFSSTDGWTQEHSSQYWSLGNGLIGTYAVANDKKSRTDDTHLATEYCLGMQCRWQTNYANFSQTTGPLPEGVYTLTFDVENTNTSTKATYENRFFVKVGETTYADDKNEWMNGTSNWTTHSISFTLSEESAATISLGYGTGSNNLGSGSTPHLYVSHLALSYIPFANDNDYEALNTAISNTNSYVMGFDENEYSPYENIEAFSILEDANAIDQTANNPQAEIQALTSKINNLTWKKNTEEVNAIWDPSFEYNYSTSGNVQPKAWTGTSGHDNATDVRWMWNVDSNNGLNATTSNKALFTKYGAFYGKQKGYTLPLNEETYYTLSFIYGGWSDCKKDGYVTMSDPASKLLNLIPSSDLPLDAVDGNSNEDSWKTIKAIFKTNDAGDYVLGLRKKDETKQSQYVYGDFCLKKTTLEDATEYYNTVLSEVSQYYDANANGGSEKINFKNAIDASIEGKTIVEIFEAAENLYSQRDAFINAIPKYNAYLAEKDYAEGIDASITSGVSAPTSAEEAVAATNTIKVNEYNYVTSNYQYGVELGTWTTTGPTGDMTGQHYSDDNAHKYLEQSIAAWGQNSWTIKYAQDITLPAGNYVFKVAGRKAVGDGVTMNLEVKNGETTLGIVSNFPEGDTGLGINKSGATSFNAADEAGFANNNAGRGWQWRYVKFTLTEQTTVNVAVNAVATIEHMWVSFCDATVQTDNEANISLIDYYVALSGAQNALNNQEYSSITGQEKNALEEAIAAEPGETAESINAATEKLKNCTNAFIAAKSAYDNYITARDKTYENNLSYASLSKFKAIGTAQSAGDATSASDAEAKTKAIISAYRQYVESNAMAEGVEGAEDKTSLIADPNFEGVTISGTSAGGWTFDQTGGNAQVTANETFTDGSGNAGPSYFDYYNGSNNNQNIHQVIENLAPGRYLLTVTGRGHTNFEGNLQLYVVSKGSVNIPAIGNTGGTFDRGWNDASVEFVQRETSNVTIGAKTSNNRAQWWGVTRFRLVKLPTETVQMTDADSYVPQAYDYANVELTRNLNKGWNPIILPFAVSADELQTKLGDGYEVAAFNGDEMDENGNVTLMFQKQEAMKANTPYLLFAPNAISTELTFDGVQIVDVANAGEVAGTNFTFVGNYTKYAKGESPIVAGDYIMSGGKLVPSANGKNAIKAFRSYLKKTTQNEVKSITITIDGEDTTGIQTIEMRESTTEGIYNLQGQKVNQAQKGVYIVNGKKVVVK